MSDCEDRASDATGGLAVNPTSRYKVPRYSVRLRLQLLAAAAGRGAGGKQSGGSSCLSNTRREGNRPGGCLRNYEVLATQSESSQSQEGQSAHRTLTTHSTHAVRHFVSLFKRISFWPSLPSFNVG